MLIANQEGEPTEREVKVEFVMIVIEIIDGIEVGEQLALQWQQTDVLPVSMGVLFAVEEGTS